MIVEGFKVAIRKKQLFIALKLLAEYDYILDQNEFEVMNVLIQSIQEDPFFMEVKLRLIERSLHLMQYNTIFQLLEVFEGLLSQCLTNPRHNIAICNTNLLQVGFIIYRLADEIKRKIPRMNSRVSKFQAELSSVLIRSTDSMSSSPLIVAQILRIRDYKGRSVLQLILETKLYEFLEVRVIEAAVRSFWLGKINFSGSFMSQSTSHEVLFNHSISDLLDSEALSRADTVTFSRQFVPGRDGKPHALSHHGIYSRMVIVYSTELLVGIILLCYFQYNLFQVSASSDPVRTIMGRNAKSLAAGLGPTFND